MATVAAFMLVYNGAWALRAEQGFAVVRHYIEQDTPIALAANIKTYQMFPFERRYRHQFSLTVASLLKKAHGHVEITDEAADEAFRIARTASPYLPAVLMVRLEYLLNTTRWQTEREEIETLLAYLRTHASRQPGVWVAEGSYALFVGDAERSWRAIQTGRSLPAGESHAAQFAELYSKLDITEISP
tara:strand:- start:173 stop:733 length:561 start_codon:yes stop_codon:yes gene_type:complete